MKTSNKARLLAASVLVSATALSAAPAYAQASGATVDELVVTARKRTESVLDVPMSINVVGEQAMKNMGAETYTDLLGSVPSLTAYQNGPGRTRLSIRGINNGGGNDNDTQNQETVGIYIDEIPISMGALNPELALFDLERVEVLRGPQGTLYGAGSMTGTVRMITYRPNLTEFEGKVDVGLSTVSHGGDGYSLKGLVNLPLITDRVAVRASAYYTQTPGYIDNVLTGEKDVNDGLARGGRIEARFKVTDDFTADLSVFKHNYKDGGRPEDLERVPGLARDYPSPDGYSDDLSIYNMTLNYDLGFANLVSSTSYFDRTVVNKRSLDGLLAAFPGVIPSPLIDTTDSEFFAQEIRLASQSDGPFTWVVGAYADKKDIYYLNTVPVPGFDAAMGINSNDFGAPTDNPYWGYDDLEVKTYAFFGELTYEWNKLSVTGGLRYFNWEQNYKLYASGFFNGAVPSDPPRRTSKEDGFNPKVNVSYDVTDDVLVYAQAARGFRYGGINTPVPQDVCAAELADFQRNGEDPNVFEADKLWNYEIGGKGTLAGGRVMVSGAYFHLVWDDMQTQRALDCGFGFRENVGGAVSDGVELEVTANPLDGLTVTAGGAYINSRLSNDVANLKAEKGDKAPFVPEFSFNASADYRFPISSEAEGFVYGGYQYTGERFTQFSPQQSTYRKMGAFSVVNVRTGVTFDNIEFSIYANNLLDDRGVIRALAATPFDPEARIRITPRTIGANVRMNF
ncbi:MAG TPA: TonB-dependent receptor [Phenylobacterium sp.]|nr:TonB-dependent receptor [Phenylobacterium sp.]